mgnify:FL=1
MAGGINTTAVTSPKIWLGTRQGADLPQVIIGGPVAAHVLYNDGGGQLKEFSSTDGKTGTVSFTINSSGIFSLNTPLAVGSGGTGDITLASNGVLYGNGTGAVSVTAQGGTNTVLTANAGVPSFSNTPTLTGTNFTGIPATGISNTAVTLSDTQTISGNKTFSGTTNINGTLVLGTALDVTNGGVGVATLATNGVLYGGGTGAVNVTAQGGANTVLTANAGAPSFTNTPTLTGTNITGIPATGITNTAVTLSDTQTISGVKTFSVNLILANQTSSTNGALNYDQTNGDLSVGDGTSAELIHVSAWKTWTPTFTGFSTAPTNFTARYILIGKMCCLIYRTGTPGTSNATNFTMTAPFAAKTATTGIIPISPIDNGSTLSVQGIAYFSAADSTINLFKTWADGTTGANNWTASGGKDLYMPTMCYEIA